MIYLPHKFMAWLFFSNDQLNFHQPISSLYERKRAFVRKCVCERERKRTIVREKKKESY